MDTLPRIVATEEERVIIGAGNTAYVSGLRSGDAINWQIFRAGESFTDPETGEVLGFEAIHVGDARVKRFGSPSTIEITRAKQEINQNDRLMPAREVSFPSYIPRAPDKPIKGVILSVRGSVSDISQFSIVTINRGSRDGVEVGHVLATMRRGDQMVRQQSPPADWRPVRVRQQEPGSEANRSSRTLWSPTPTRRPPRPSGAGEQIILPDERSGPAVRVPHLREAFVRHDHEEREAISVGDVVQTP